MAEFASSWEGFLLVLVFRTALWRILLFLVHGGWCRSSVGLLQIGCRKSWPSGKWMPRVDSSIKSPTICKGNSITIWWIAEILRSCVRSTAPCIVSIAGLMDCSSSMVILIVCLQMGNRGAGSCWYIIRGRNVSIASWFPRTLSDGSTPGISVLVPSILLHHLDHCVILLGLLQNCINLLLPTLKSRVSNSCGLICVNKTLPNHVPSGSGQSLYMLVNIF